MIYNCDMRKEKKAERLADDICQRAKWHRRFAWLPVKLYRGTCVWLEFYEIRAEVQWPSGYSTEYTPGRPFSEALKVAETCVFYRTDLNISWTRKLWVS